MKDPKWHSIGDVKEKTGLTERRIRYYETLDLLSPRRTAGNQRLYSDRDIERLRLIKEWLDQGDSLRRIRVRLAERDQRERQDDDRGLERDADSYFLGKRIARGAGARSESLYPLKDRGAALRRIMREHGFEEDE